MKEEALWCWRYELRSATRLNAVSQRRSFPGMLLRKGAGFACLHPWGELGDPSLKDCLVDLRQCAIGRRTLACLALDAEAREKGESLFRGIIVPQSHATLPELSEEAIQESREQGFTHLKVKVQGDPSPVRAFLARHSDLVWRLDFNGTGQPNMFQDWTAEECACIDFVEDPFLPEAGDWSDLPVTVAADRFSGEAPVRVIKPAVEEVSSDAPRLVVTSYMDHPVGQAFAAWEAGRARVSEICGLQTHGLFEKDAFTEALGELGPQFCPPEGVGLGFDDLLERLPWKRV